MVKRKKKTAVADAENICPNNEQSTRTLVLNLNDYDKENIEEMPIIFVDGIDEVLPPPASFAEI